MFNYNSQYSPAYSKLIQIISLFRFIVLIITMMCDITCKMYECENYKKRKRKKTIGLPPSLYFTYWALT